MKDFLERFVSRGGTIFFSTHVLEIAELICTSVGIIYEGRLIHQGPMKDLRKKKKRLDDFFLKLVGGIRDGRPDGAPHVREV